MRELIFGQGKVFEKFCPVCGLEIYEGDGGCKRYHKSAVKKEKQARTHGKSNSENRWNNA
jgi:hypothetical protein